MWRETLYKYALAPRPTIKGSSPVNIKNVSPQPISLPKGSPLAAHGLAGETLMNQRAQFAQQHRAAIQAAPNRAAKGAARLRQMRGGAARQAPSAPPSLDYQRALRARANNATNAIRQQQMANSAVRHNPQMLTRAGQQQAAQQAKLARQFAAEEAAKLAPSAVKGATKAAPVAAAASSAKPVSNFLSRWGNRAKWGGRLGLGALALYGGWKAMSGADPRAQQMQNAYQGYGGY